MSNKTRLKNRIDELMEELDSVYSVINRVNAHFGLTKLDGNTHQLYAVAEWIDNLILNEQE